jgi:hypothetical protein
MRHDIFRHSILLDETLSFGANLHRTHPKPQGQRASTEIDRGAVRSISATQDVSFRS